MIRNVLLAAVLAGLTAAASAAPPDAGSAGPTLSVTQGTVMVNDGSQFLTAKPGQVLKTGERVMVLDGSSASLSFADGHKLELVAGSLVTINNSSDDVTIDGKTHDVSMSEQPVGDDDRDHNRDACQHDHWSQALGDDDNRRVCEDDKGRINRRDGYLADHHGFILDKDRHRIKCKCGVAWWDNGTGTGAAAGSFSSDQQLIATFAAWTAITACGIHEICNGSHEHPISAP